MPTTRDDLIADWRDRLAEASEVSVEASSRPAWLTRLRIRLYQFLLSLYGDGQWHATDATNKSDQQPGTALPPDVPIAWQGKPAKELSTIRAVLSSVAEARPAPNVPGSFAEGTGADAWVVIATLNGGIHPPRCASLLQARHVYARWINRKDEVTVEVRAKDETNASRIIQANINRLRIFRRFVVPSRPLCGFYLATTAYRFTFWLDRWSFTLITVFYFTLVIPLAYVWAAIMSDMKMSQYQDLNLWDDLFHDYFWLAVRSLLTLAIVLTCLRLHWRARERQATMPSMARGIDG